jgi:hypothetical protein
MQFAKRRLEPVQNANFEPRRVEKHPFFRHAQQVVFADRINLIDQNVLDFG